MSEEGTSFSKQGLQMVVSKKHNFNNLATLQWNTDNYLCSLVKSGNSLWWDYTNINNVQKFMNISCIGIGWIKHFQNYRIYQNIRVSAGYLLS